MSASPQFTEANSHNNNNDSRNGMIFVENVALDEKSHEQNVLGS